MFFNDTTFFARHVQCVGDVAGGANSGCYTHRVLNKHYKWVTLQSSYIPLASVYLEKRNTIVAVCESKILFVDPVTGAAKEGAKYEPLTAVPHAIQVVDNTITLCWPDCSLQGDLRCAELQWTVSTPRKDFKDRMFMVCDGARLFYVEDDKVIMSDGERVMELGPMRGNDERFSAWPQSLRALVLGDHYVLVGHRNVFAFCLSTRRYWTRIDVTTGPDSPCLVVGNTLFYRDQAYTF